MKKGGKREGVVGASYPPKLSPAEKLYVPQRPHGGGAHTQHCRGEGAYVDEERGGRREEERKGKRLEEEGGICQWRVVEMRGGRECVVRIMWWWWDVCVR